jgi:hypothetical protein
MRKFRCCRCGQLLGTISLTAPPFVAYCESCRRGMVVLFVDDHPDQRGYQSGAIGHEGKFDWFPDARLTGVHGPECRCEFCESWRGGEPQAAD